jgi:hypothetical protein
MAVRKGSSALTASVTVIKAGGESGGSSRGKALQRFVGWAGRSGFFFLAAAAFCSSLSLVALRGRALDLDGTGAGDQGRGGGGGGEDGAAGARGTEEGDFDANGTLTKNAAFKLEVTALLNHSVPIFLSRRAIKSTRPFSCGGSAVVKFRTYADVKKVSKLADSLPPSDPMTMAGDPTWRRYKSCAVVGNSGGAWPDLWLLSPHYGRSTRLRACFRPPPHQAWQRRLMPHSRSRVVHSLHSTGAQLFELFFIIRRDCTDPTAIKPHLRHAMGLCRLQPPPSFTGDKL